MVSLSVVWLLASKQLQCFCFGVCYWFSFLDKGKSRPWTLSKESIYSQKRGRTLELQEFLDSKPQTRNFTKTIETKVCYWCTRIILVKGNVTSWWFWTHILFECYLLGFSLVPMAMMTSVQCKCTQFLFASCHLFCGGEEPGMLWCSHVYENCVHWEISCISFFSSIWCKFLVPILSASEQNTDLIVGVLVLTWRYVRVYIFCVDLYRRSTLGSIAFLIWVCFLNEEIKRVIMTGCHLCLYGPSMDSCQWK